MNFKIGGTRTTAARANLLQRKIFSKWVNQRISKKNIVVDDIVTSCGDGTLVIALMEGISPFSLPHYYTIFNNVCILVSLCPICSSSSLSSSPSCDYSK
jgi:hypothetical protein